MYSWPNHLSLMGFVGGVGFGFGSRTKPSLSLDEVRDLPPVSLSRPEEVFRDFDSDFKRLTGFPVDLELDAAGRGRFSCLCFLRSSFVTSIGDTRGL